MIRPTGGRTPSVFELEINLLRFFRTRLLLLSASAVMLALGVGFAAFVAIAAASSVKPLAPQLVLEEAISMHQGDNGFSLFEPLNAWDREERLRGLTKAEAERILAACRKADDWTYMGEEERSAFDCSRYELASCGTDAGDLVARLWMDVEKVDHIADLALSSEFLACKMGQCPDFAVGEPRLDGVLRCETRFKVNRE